MFSAYGVNYNSAFSLEGLGLVFILFLIKGYLIY